MIDCQCGKSDNVFTCRCGKCGNKLLVSNEMLGQRIECPGCGATISLPTPEAVAKARRKAEPTTTVPRPEAIPRIEALEIALQEESAGLPLQSSSLSAHRGPTRSGAGSRSLVPQSWGFLLFCFVTSATLFGSIYVGRVGLGLDLVVDSATGGPILVFITAVGAIPWIIFRRSSYPAAVTIAALGSGAFAACTLAFVSHCGVERGILAGLVAGGFSFVAFGQGKPDQPSDRRG